MEKEKNSYLFGAKVLIKQIEEESLPSFLWMLSSVNRCLLNDENMTLLEFKNLIKKTCPESHDDFKRVMKMKELDFVD